MGNVCPPGPNPLTVNLPVSHRKRFSALHFDYRPEDCSETLEVVNSNFSQRPYAAIVIPPRPCGTRITVERAGGMNFADCALFDSSPTGPECRCEFHERRAHPIQTMPLGKLSTM